MSGIQIFFFFFQAEDGIRDLTVTGVQTCALPISGRRRRAAAAMRRSLGQLVPRRPPSARAAHPPRAGVRPLLHPRQLESRAPPRGGGPGPLSRVWLRPGIPAAAPAPAPPAVGRALGGAARVRGVP